jgi:predicted nuclease of predicted toxin-antitoxin system
VKLKLDENIGRRGLELLRAAGHDVMTVREQQLQGAKDDVLFAVCAGEARALVTLDHDFGQVLRFPPDRSAGIAILEIGRRGAAQSLLDRLHDLAALLETRPLAGELWIVEPGRVRIHISETDA